MQANGKTSQKYALALCSILLFVLALPALPVQANPSVPGSGGLQATPSSPGAGGFQGPSAQGATTVAAARRAWDDTYVTLVGHIVQRLSEDDYLFRDATGEIVVDIDYHVFHGQTVTPQTKVRISGEVDSEIMERTTIDVYMLEVL